MSMVESFEKRLEAAEKAWAARNPDGKLKLTTHGGPPVLFHKSEVEAIAAAKAAGRTVFISDEVGPENPIL